VLKLLHGSELWPDMLNSNFLKNLFFLSIFLRYSYSHLSEHQCSAEHNLGNDGLNTGCPNLFCPRATPIIVGWFTGLAYKNHNK